MKLPTVDKFFFCLSLEIGAMVLAGLSFATSISIISTVSYFLARYVRFYGTLNETDQDFFRTILISKLSSLVGFVMFDWNIFTALVIVYTIYILYFAIIFVAGVLLIIGTLKVSAVISLKFYV